MDTNAIERLVVTDADDEVEALRQKVEEKAAVTLKHDHAELRERQARLGAANAAKRRHRKIAQQSKRRNRR